MAFVLRSHVAALAAAAVLLAPASSSAQLRRIPAEITPLTESDAARAGSTVRVALKVALPDGYHVQSNKPRDASLIPTELSIDAPADVQIEELVFPEAEDFKQEGLPEPLLVFEREFVIGVRLSLAGGLPPGDLVVPARLRYQACDDKMCYAPANAQAQWTLKVVGAKAAVTPQHADVFGAIAFGTGEKPGVAPAATGAPARPGCGWGWSRRRTTRALQPGRQHRRLSRHRRLPHLHQERRVRRGRKRVVRGAGSDRDPAHRAPGRAGAEPHAVRPADDSDQPGDHRRRRPGLVAAAGVPSRPHLRRRHGLRLRRPRPDRRAHGQHLRHDQRVPVVQPRHRVAVRRAGARDVRRVRDRLLEVLGQPGRRRRPRDVPPGVHDGHGRGPARRRVRGAGRDPGGALRQQPLRDGHQPGARASLLPRHRDGGAMAHRRRGSRVAPQARARGWFASSRPSVS